MALEELGRQLSSEGACNTPAGDSVPGINTVDQKIRCPLLVIMGTKHAISKHT